jgi:tripartite ATP-independent transporter DctP family solute receptor
MKVKTYSDGTLGAEAQTISAAQGGVQEMTLVSSAPMVGVVKEFALFDLPFLFQDEKEADAVLDGPIGKKLLDKLPEKNLIGLCYWENGFRNVTNSKRPISKAEDIQGLKIRTMQNPVYTDVFNTLGANAVPMAMTEVYTALETKAIDAQENPYAIINASKFNEVQKYVSATRHAYAPAPVLVSKKFWDKLSPDEQKVLQEACVETRDYQRKISREQTSKALAELKSKGMAFNEISPEELAKMREKVKPVVQKYSKEVGEDLVKQTYAEIEKVRSK